MSESETISNPPLSRRARQQQRSVLLAQRALGWVPLLAALIALGKLCSELTHQSPVVVDIPARCHGACVLELPDRHGALIAVRLLLPSTPLTPWQVCARGECRSATPRDAFGWIELPVGRTLRAESLQLIPAQLNTGERAVRGRALYGWPGWRTVLSRARRTWGW